jgi:glutamate formiminotransferase
MPECVALSELVAQRIAAELQLPVYLYYESARRPERRWLPHIRRGEYETLKEEIATHPDRAPDFGPAHLGPAGAIAVGARPFLIAFNVNLATPDQGLARAIARAIRQSSGGLPAVQARGMPTADPNIVQVSTNLLDYRITPLHQLYDRIRTLAAAQAVEVASSEVVGLLPTEALAQTAAHHYRLPHFGPASLLEHRILSSLLD